MLLTSHARTVLFVLVVMSHDDVVVVGGGRWIDEDNDHDIVCDVRADNAATSGRRHHQTKRLTDWLDFVLL